MKNILIKVLIPIFGLLGGIGGALEFIFRKDIAYNNVADNIDEYLKDHPEKEQEIAERFLNSR